MGELIRPRDVPYSKYIGEACCQVFIGVQSAIASHLQTKFFSATSSLDYIYSDLLSFTFEANHRYDIGISFDTGSAKGSWYFGGTCGTNVATAQGNFESIYGNANISGGRSDTGYACVDPHLLLITGWVVAVTLDRQGVSAWWVRFADPAPLLDNGAIPLALHAQRGAYWSAVGAALLYVSYRWWPTGPSRAVTSRR